MATWKRILVDGDVTGTSPIEVTGDTPTISLGVPTTTNDGEDQDDKILIYDVTQSEWTTFTLEQLYINLAEVIAQAQIDGGGSTSVFAPNGVLGDLNGDGLVSSADLLIMFANYGVAPTAETEYIYENQTLSFTTWGAANTEEILNISNAGTANSQSVTVTVDTNADTITLSTIPATAGLQNLYISIVPETFQVSAGAFQFTAQIKHWDQSNTLVGTTNYDFPTLVLANSVAWGSNYESSLQTITVPSANLISGSSEAPSKIEITLKCTLILGNGAPNSETHKARVNDLTISYT